MSLAKRALRYLNIRRKKMLIWKTRASNEIRASVNASWYNRRNATDGAWKQLCITETKCAPAVTLESEWHLVQQNLSSRLASLSGACVIISCSRLVLRELDVAQEPTNIYQDNGGLITWATGDSGKQSAKRKRIDIRHHYVMDMWDKSTIQLNQIPTKKMGALFDNRYGPEAFNEVITHLESLSTNYSKKQSARERLTNCRSDVVRLGILNLEKPEAAREDFIAMIGRVIKIQRERTIRLDDAANTVYKKHIGHSAHLRKSMQNGIWFIYKGV